MDRCQWKMVDESEFTLGIVADRCGKDANIKIFRPQRKNDLFLCEDHFNYFVHVWGLKNNNVKILCRCPGGDTQ